MLAENNSGRAIIVLDMVDDVVGSYGDSFSPPIKEIIPYISGELQYFRERMRPVIFCNSSENSYSNNTGELCKEIQPRSKEIVVKKTRPDAFFNTDLKSILDNLKIKNLTIVGICAHTGVLLSAASALNFGFSVVVPETCVASFKEQDYQASLHIIRRWLAENI